MNNLENIKEIIDQSPSSSGIYKMLNENFMLLKNAPASERSLELAKELNPLVVLRID